MHFSHFGSFKGGHFKDFDVFIFFFDILVFLTGKLIFLWQKNTLQIIRMAIMLSKLPKYPKTTKCPEV